MIPVERIRHVASYGFWSPHFPEDTEDTWWGISSEWRYDYASIKYAISRILRPKRICEIGIYSGIAALSFLSASPKAEYVGYDNLSGEEFCGASIVRSTINSLCSLGYKVTGHFPVDSQRMENLDGEFDFIHVDGDHSRAGAYHDVILSWNALSSGGHMLIDNGHDMNVSAGTFDALRDLTTSLVDWAYFEHAVGNILVRKPL